MTEDLEVSCGSFATDRRAAKIAPCPLSVAKSHGDFLVHKHDAEIMHDRAACRINRNQRITSRCQRKITQISPLTRRPSRVDADLSS
jgi:hypothetical protein